MKTDTRNPGKRDGSKAKIADGGIKIRVPEVMTDDANLLTPEWIQARFERGYFIEFNRIASARVADGESAAELQTWADSGEYFNDVMEIKVRAPMKPTVALMQPDKKGMVNVAEFMRQNPHLKIVTQ